jgi:integrase
VPRNVASGIKGLETVRRTMIRTLAAKDVTAFFHAARESEDRFEALYILAIMTGLRQGELLGLNWADVDLEREVLEVQRSLSVVDNKPVLKDWTKTDAGRAVQMHQIAAEAVQRHRTRQLEERLRYAGLWKDNDLVFPSRTGGPMHRQNLARRSFKPRLRRAGLPDVRFYDLRHTFATLMFKQDAKPKVVQEMLGHASIKTTLDTYTHVIPGMQKEAVERLGELF